MSETTSKRTSGGPGLLRIPSKIDEKTLVHQLHGAEGTHFFSDQILLGERPILRLSGIAHPAPPEVIDGVWVFTFGNDQGEAISIPFFLHQSTYALALHRNLLASRVLPAPALKEMHRQPYNDKDEAHIFSAETLDGEPQRIRLLFRSDDLAWELEALASELLLWSRAILETYRKMSHADREVRLIIAKGIGQAVTVPIERMKPEGAATNEDLAPR